MGKKNKKANDNQGLIDTIDEQIAAEEMKLEKYYEIRSKVDRLRAARRALTGGNKLTGEGGTKIRMDDVVEYLGKNPGSTPTEIAKALGGTYTQISSHLSRKRDERFLSKNRRWWLRDPKNGLNTADDIEDEEDE